MLLEWTLSIGNILTIFLMSVSALWVIASMRAELRILDTRLLGVEKAINKITDILVSISRQDERLRNLENKVDLFYENGSKRLHEIVQQYSNGNKTYNGD